MNDTETELRRFDSHLVMRFELTSEDLTGLEAACSMVVKEMKRTGRSYSGPMSLPKQKVRTGDSFKEIHTRLFEMDTDDAIVMFLMSFTPPENVKVKCTVAEKKYS